MLACGAVYVKYRHRQSPKHQSRPITYECPGIVRLPEEPTHASIGFTDNENKFCKDGRLPLPSLALKAANAGPPVPTLSP